MIKRLQELARCTSLNPSLCCIKCTRSSGGNAGGISEAGSTWVVCSSGDTVVSLNPSLPSEQNRSVKVQFGADCSSAFLLSGSPEGDASQEIVVCLSNGEVHLLSVRKCLDTQPEGKGKQRQKRSGSATSVDLPAKRFKKESIVDIEESSPQPRSSVVKSSDDIFISLLDSDDDDAEGGSDGGDAIKDKSDVRDSDSDSGVQQMVSTTSAIAVNRVVGAIPPATHSSKEDFVSSEDVSSLWFVREHWHQVVLAGHQLGRDTLLLQVGEPPGNASVKLEVYQWQAGQDREQSVKLVSRLSLPVGVATVCEEPGFIPATLPLPLSIVNHQSGEQIGSWAPSHVISSSFYRQLFGPELALVKLPILLLGAPTGEVFYAPVNNMFAGVSYNVFLGPLFCLSQVVKGIHPIRIHHSDVCDGLVLIGGRGKVLLCLEGRGGERNMHPPRIEILHAGFTVLASCLLSPCLLAIAGMKCVKIVDLTFAIGSPGGHDRNIQLQQLHKAFYKASRLEVAEIIRLKPLVNASPDERSCVAFDFDGGLSVIDISEKVLDECRSCSTATSSTATVKERIAVKMTKLRQLESEGEYAAERLEKVEGYIRDVNMALHTAHLLTTGKATAFRVEEVTAIETGRSDSCCLKVSLAYGGQLRLGAGWSFILSASADDTGLHVMQLPEMRHTMDGGDGGDCDGAAHSSVSSLEGMSPGSLCHCYLTLASHTAVRPLLLTCSLQYNAIEAAEYLSREPVNVSAVILKKSLSVLDFMQPVPANVHISSSSQATRRHATGLKSNSNETRTITISRETVYKCVSCTGNHDNKTLLHRFLHVLVGRRDSGLPVQSVGKDDMGLRLVLPDRSIFLLSIKGALGEKQDLYECVCKSHSYNSLMAGTDAVIDHIGCLLKEDSSSRNSHTALPQQSTTMAVKDLLSEVSRCTRLVREMKQKGPLEQYLMDKLKALNTEVIAFKSSLL